MDKQMTMPNTVHMVESPIASIVAVGSGAPPSMSAYIFPNCGMTKLTPTFVQARANANVPTATRTMWIHERVFAGVKSEAFIPQDSIHANTQKQGKIENMRLLSSLRFFNNISLT